MKTARRATRPLVSVWLAALVVLLAQAVLAQPAAAWWNGDWTGRMKINADTGPKGAAITEPIGRTQVLVRLHSGNFNFATAKDDGSDLRFVDADDRTPLHFHIEKYDGLVDQVGLIWVDLPAMAPGVITPFYMYWDNKNATVGGDPHATYDADQLLVYHFTEENGLPKDATGYANNALTAGKRDDGGMVGFGIRLDGTAPIQVQVSPSLVIPAGQPMTWSMWFNPGKDVKTATLYQHREGGNALTIGIDAGVPFAQIESGAPGTATVQRATGGGPITPDAWHLIAVTATDKLSVYLDGEKRGEVTATLPALAGAAAIGGAVPGAPAAAPAPVPAATATATAPATPATTPAPAGTPAAAATAATPAAPSGGAPAAAAPAPAPNFIGLIDEFRISKVARPVGAIQVWAHSEGPQANLIGFDVPEEASAFGSGYIGIIMRSVTPDAWVVIIILGIMAVISFAVMIGKGIYLGRIGRANNLFREAFRTSVSRAAGAASIGLAGVSAEKLPGVRHSPLYRVYAVGVAELADREANGVIDANGMVPPQSLAAIRATMDATLVREVQRLNRLMVLLTIAIAGGPFIGLLGTVIGVMITFAAIAAAGDVNVNAIAPGISAALLATVAGLLVAIPSLFGYNYFSTRIRDATAELHVFAEELVARMGEGGGGAVARKGVR